MSSSGERVSIVPESSKARSKSESSTTLRHLPRRLRRCGDGAIRSSTSVPTAALALGFVASALRSPGASASAAAAFAAVGDNRRRLRCSPRRAIPISPTPCASVSERRGLVVADARLRYSRRDVRSNALFDSTEDAAPGRRCGDDRGSFKFRRRGVLSSVWARTVREPSSILPHREATRRRVLTALLAVAGCCLLYWTAAPASVLAYVDAAASSAVSGVAEPAAAAGAAAIDLASKTAASGALSSAPASVSAVAVSAAATSPPRLFVHRIGGCLLSACRRAASSLGTSVRLNAGLAARLLYASFVGGCVGLHRPKSTHVADRSGNGMGTRTFALVALGACMFTLCGTHGLTNMYGIRSSCSPDVVPPSMASQPMPPIGPQVKIDVSRMASNVATGVGFIGAGVITSNRRPDGTVDVRGLTTAASVWVSAAVGIAAGAGMYFAAACGMAVTVAVIRWGKILPSSHSHDVIDRRRPRQRRRRRHQRDESSADLVAAATIPTAADLTDSGLLPPPPTSLEYDYLPAVVPTSSSSLAHPSTAEDEPLRRVKIDPVREMEERYHRSRGRGCAEDKNGRGDGTSTSAGGGQQRDSSSSSLSDPEFEGLPMASSSTLLHDGRDEELEAALLGASGGRLTRRGGGTGGSNQTVWDDCAP